jgi:MoaA/NifB/PqqE/SkfB family radical SAM enzyme
MTQVDTLCVELTLRCPLRCVHCSANAAPERREMLDASLLIQRLRELGHLEGLYLEYRARVEVTEAARSVTQELVIYSSGVSADRRSVEPISERAIQAVARKVDRVDISIYSLSPAEHDQVTGIRGSLQASLETIRRLRLLGVPFGIHFVPLRGVYALSQVVQYAREVRAKRFHVLALARQGRASGLSLPYTPALLEAMRLLMGSNAGMEIVLSSHIRRLLGLGATSRDELSAAFLDVRGHLYSSEGARTPDKRSTRTLTDSALADLISDMA